MFQAHSTSKLKKKHCYHDKYGTYDTLKDAQQACSIDDNCQGVLPALVCYPLAGRIYLCPKTATYEDDDDNVSCIYHKSEGKYWAF